MKIISYNVNGIRAAVQKDFINWLKATQADVVCLQEIKAYVSQIPQSLFEDLGYHCYWFPAEKAGYSGVAILTKIKPTHVERGCSVDMYDREGRTLRIDFPNLSVMSVYMPSGSNSPERQSFKMEWLTFFQTYIQQLKKELPNLVIAGDYNICHQPIDIHNPAANAKSPGFLPEERQWMSNFLENDLIDTFRYFNKEPHHYTWWNVRSRAREKNLGWRIDYQIATHALAEKLKRALILCEAFHSDHCPTFLELDV